MVSVMSTCPYCHTEKNFSAPACPTCNRETGYLLQAGFGIMSFVFTWIIFIFVLKVGFNLLFG
jgi:hypothetical protein